MNRPDPLRSRPSPGIAARAALAGLVLLAACDSSPVDPDPDVLDFLDELTIDHDPSGTTPLTAEATVVPNRPLQVEVVVPARDGGVEVRHLFPTTSQETDLPILGLYPGHANVVKLRFFEPGGSLLGETERTITTPPLPAAFPTIEIETADAGAMKPGMNLVGYYGNLSPHRPFIFDATGAIRWYFDPTDHPSLSSLVYGNGVERLASGNLIFGDKVSGQIVMMNMLGRTVATWDLTGYDFHHHVLEKPDGNFLVTVDEEGAETIEDRVIEIHRNTKEILRVWDLTRSLDAERRAWPSSFGDLDVDWFHANGLAWDPGDGTIIVSGRTQGTVKLTEDNEVVWILAPHREWETAGDGTDLSTRLLQPLDAAGMPIEDPAVLDGTANHPDFEWAWYQHAPKVMPDGTLLLFDNGDNRNYTGQQLYSRAVAYRIDPDAMTVQQVWSYGKERGEETFSRIVSDVDYHEAEDNIVFMPGANNTTSTAYGKVVEVDRTTRQVVFEATVFPPVDGSAITFHRVDRVSLYPGG